MSDAQPRKKILQERITLVGLGPYSFLKRVPHYRDLPPTLLDLARDLVNTEKEVPAAEDEDRAKTALTELFQQTRSADTPIMVERIVDDIDDIVRQIRFPDWQSTEGGKREVRKALRRTLAKYKLHTDTELFEKAYGYVKEYY